MNNLKEELFYNHQGTQVAPLKKRLKSVSPQIRLYTKRWLVLLVFIIFTAIHDMHGVTYVIIENIMTKYYGVSSLAIETTSTISGILYVVLFIPMSYMLHKLSLRNACLLAAIGTAAGAWIKFFAVSPDLFYLALFGQALCLCWMIILLAAPVTIAACWFGPKEVAMATAMGSFGMTLGIALICYLTPIVVRNHTKVDDIGHDLYYLMLVLAIATTAATLAMIAFFKSEPPMPPSKSRALQKLHSTEDFNFLQQVYRILKNKNFLLLWNGHGINNGMLNAINTTMNRTYLSHFKDGEQTVGILSMLLLVVGTVGSIFVGHVQDKTKKFKELLIILYILTIVSQITYAVSICLEVEWGVYIGVIFLGFAGLAYISTGYETCVEITYPESESISIAILNAANQAYGCILIIIVNQLLDFYGTWVAQAFLSGTLIVGLIITICTEDVQKRQNAMKSEQTGLDSDNNFN